MTETELKFSRTGEHGLSNNPKAGKRTPAAREADDVIEETEEKVFL